MSKKKQYKRREQIEQNAQLESLHAMAKELQISADSQTDAGIRSRMAQIISGGYDFYDTLHNIFLDYGYPSSLTFTNFWNMYRRFGIAKNVIELPVDTSWITAPTVVSKDTKFLNELNKLIVRVDMWTRIKGLDTRQRVGRYAGMFMRVRDGKQPSEPIEGTLSSEQSLIGMTPLYENQLQVTESDQNPMSDTFGQPIILQYSTSLEGDRNEETNTTINIHVSRIVFAAEGADDGWIYGIPTLESIFNSLMDLRKIIGGGGEGFYKNASQNIVFDLKDGASAIAYKDKLDNFNEQYDEFSRNRFRRAMWTPGMEAKTLDSNLMSPKEFFDVALNDVAAGAKIPATIVIGKQTGRLASTEDSRQFLGTVKSRRVNFVTPMVRDVIDWLMRFGLVPTAAYEVEWDDLLAQSQEEKLTSSEKMSNVNQTQFRSGGSAVFEEDEIREVAGFERINPIDPGSEHLDDEDEENED